MDNYSEINNFINSLYDNAFSGKQTRAGKQFIFKVLAHIKYNMNKSGRKICIWDRMKGEKNRRKVRTIIEYLKDYGYITKAGELITHKTQKGFPKKAFYYKLADIFKKVLLRLDNLKITNVYEKIAQYIPTFSKIQAVFSLCGINLKKKYNRHISHDKVYTIDKNNRIYNIETQQEESIFSVYSKIHNIHIFKAYGKIIS